MNLLDRLLRRKKPKKITIADMTFIRNRMRDREARWAFNQAINEMRREEEQEND